MFVAELGGERLRGEARPPHQRAAALGDGDAEETLRGREALVAERSSRILQIFRIESSD